MSVTTIRFQPGRPSSAVFRQNLDLWCVNGYTGVGKEGHNGRGEVEEGRSPRPLQKLISSARWFFDEGTAYLRLCIADIPNVEHHMMQRPSIQQLVLVICPNTETQISDRR